jgi:hypothetical protein
VSKKRKGSQGHLQHPCTDMISDTTDTNGFNRCHVSGVVGLGIVLGIAAFSDVRFCFEGKMGERESHLGDLESQALAPS